MTSLQYRLEPAPQDPPHCLRCDRMTGTYRTRHSNRNGNAGRPYAKCQACGKFHCFMDQRGNDPTNPSCQCGGPSKRQVSNPEKGRIVHYVCRLGTCIYYAPYETAFRTEILQTIFEALHQKEQDVPRFCTLSIENLQNLNDLDVVESEAFRNILCKLSQLHLGIATENENANPEINIGRAAAHAFCAERKLWLEPVKDNLTYLTLYARAYWGWAPAVDLRKIAFPQLRYLALGNHTFAHDLQIDWLSSFGATLETLILDDCPILFYMWPSFSLAKYTSAVSHEDHTRFLIRGEHGDDPY